MTECKTIKMMEIRWDRHFIETNTFLANRESENNTEKPFLRKGKKKSWSEEIRTKT